MTSYQNLVSGPPYSQCNVCPNTKLFKKRHSFGLKNGRQALKSHIKRHTFDTVDDNVILPDSELFLYNDQDIAVTCDIGHDRAYHIVIWFHKCGYFNVSGIQRDFPDLYNKVFQFICNDLKSALNIKEIKIWSSERTIDDPSTYLHAHFQIVSGDAIRVPPNLYEITKTVFAEKFKN